MSSSSLDLSVISVRTSSLRTIQVLSVLAALGFMMFCAAVLLDAHRDAERQALEADSNLSQAVAQDISRTFELYDLSLQRVITALKEPSLAKAAPALRRLALYNGVASASYINRITVLNPKGDVIEDSGESSLPKLNSAGRSYFTAQRDSPEQGLYISKPFRSRTKDGDWIIAISRRISGPNGSFDGVAVAIVSLSYFETLFANLKSGSDDIFAVLRDDGTMIMHNPFRMSYIGHNFGSREFFKQDPSFENRIHEADARDGIRRIYSFAKVQNLPLVVAVGSSKSRMFATWRQKAKMIGAMTAILSAAIATLGTMLTRELRRRLKAETELAALASDLAVAATTDGLTGLANRRSFDKIAVKEWSRAIRNCEPISILVIDVDFFKKYNDNYGHAQGDNALKAVASHIESHLRRSADFGARYGGEEFAILLPATDIQGAYEVAEALRRSVMQTRLMDRTGAVNMLTVSVGVTSINPEVEDLFSEAFAAADRALYRAKNLGRNRVECAISGESPSVEVELSHKLSSLDNQSKEISVFAK